MMGELCHNSGGSLVFRWIGCCCLLLGLTGLAAAKSHPRSRAIEDSADPQQTFGLQVDVGSDGKLHPNRSSRKSIAQAGYSESLPDDTDEESDRVNLIDWEQVEGEEVLADCDDDWRVWQVLPDGLMYKAYLAGEKESRMQAVWFSSPGREGLAWECALGGHVGILRHGTTNAINPQGWQLDLEGAALPRVDLGHESDLESCDFRAGFLSTWRYGANAYKAGYYHLSSHAGDEYLIRYPKYVRLNYVRDSLIVGWTRNLTEDLQIYGEAAYAFNHEDGAEPIELQYGIQYSPMIFGLRGAPYAAINGHTRQDFGYITSVNAMAGWQWRGYSNRLWRFGLQYYTGPAYQWEFAGQNETLYGGGMYMDF